jgi:hypothetical protein
MSSARVPFRAYPSRGRCDNGGQPAAHSGAGLDAPLWSASALSGLSVAWVCRPRGSIFGWLMSEKARVDGVAVLDERVLAFA